MELIESDIITNGVKLHIYRTNTDKPPLIFAHGSTDNGLCYWPTAQEFAAEYEIILYDSRNHGLSDSVRRGGMRDRAHDLAGIVERLKLQQPFLVGHSLGAATIAVFAGLYPVTARGIVLEDPPPLELLAQAQDSDVIAAWRAENVRDKEKSVQELIRKNRRKEPHWPEEERLPWAQSKQQFSLNIYDEELLDKELGEQIVAQIVCPTLILTADQEKGGLMPQETAEEWVAALPSAQHVHIAGAGHNIRRDRPQEFLAAVKEFLATVP